MLLDEHNCTINYVKRRSIQGRGWCWPPPWRSPAPSSFSPSACRSLFRFDQFQPPPPLPRSCISSDGKKREKKKKKVQFAEDVVDPVGNSEDFRKQHSNCNRNIDDLPSKPRERGGGVRDMPANRVALYNGMLRDRLVHRSLAYSY
ncbi:hypothetical protein Acr_13g0011430 [Actinidia rufa]|uniref:Uncharacterized protein n=1 Tax=Actinidia rufa TaxID=165716 RepID=A0A7J0FMD4_9ERIC|nr:hypothetical protein Acr_13g0011430 [Actinidia rufa]